MHFYVYEVSNGIDRARVVLTVPANRVRPAELGVQLRLIGVFPNRELAEAAQEEEGGEPEQPLAPGISATMS